MPNNSVTAIDGVLVGHTTNQDSGTGCTVVLTPKGAIGGVDVRGGAPGTLETDLLTTGKQITHIHGLMLSGGSAFGLEAASGALEYLSERKIGYKTGENVIPIIPSAIIYDLNYKQFGFPSKSDGKQACLNASSDPVTIGSVGAGTGATVAKMNGFEHSVKSGVGNAAITLQSGIKIAVLVVVNAYGSIINYENGSTIAKPLNTGNDFNPFELSQYFPKTSCSKSPTDSPLNTTIGVIITNADLTKEQVNYLAKVSHDGLAMTIFPCHTLRDGDTLFALSTSELKIPVDMTALGIAATKVTADAVLSAVKKR
ncbi:MAG TPA: peptidase S58 [Dehalococcoidia bacterium]|nr:peptidase S58 [Dehalococcoidia bacterium]